MRTLAAFLFSLFTFPLSSFAAAPELLPDGRQTVDVRAGERNPFTQQAAPEQGATASSESASEEARLRRIIRAVKIGGVSGGNGQFRILLGSLILSPGETLPPIIRNQSEMLRVLSVDESSLTLAFVERDPSADPRKIVLPVGMKPEVSQFMFGEAVESLLQIGPRGAPKLPPLESPAVAEILNSSQEVELRNVADRDVKLMGGVQDAENPEQ